VIQRADLGVGCGKAATRPSRDLRDGDPLVGRNPNGTRRNLDTTRDGECLWLVSVPRAAALAHGDVDTAFFNLPSRLRPVLGFSACFASRDGFAADWRSSRKTSKHPMQPTPEKIPLPNFTSKDGLVRVLTSTNPRRWPRHKFPVVLIRLIPCPGTRVLLRPDSSVEYMPRWSEVAQICSQMGLTISVPPDKPESRRTEFERINAHRHGRGE
jgi:hypothetical protein